VHHDILAALAQPTIAHTSQVLADLIKDALDGIRLTAGTAAAPVFVFAGSGTLAQEAALVNLVAPGERVLVGSMGTLATASSTWRRRTASTRPVWRRRGVSRSRRNSFERPWLRTVSRRHHHARRHINRDRSASR
jgi:hypothetical protein